MTLIKRCNSPRAAAEQRPGFKELLAQVTLGLVGIILSYDVTRLSRNCSDWFPLLGLVWLQRLFDC
ncbi:recombinase family protein [Fischerella sp. PCC 9605]|uniref:recombinase family protein n=1 Tax=Fischerella sp. PCC 9605 TaxID=1173024 RepID=UPI001E4803C9|nr:recombinase family protein [Fischerella sp. PCC 9605]